MPLGAAMPVGYSGWRREAIMIERVTRTVESGELRLQQALSCGGE